MSLARTVTQIAGVLSLAFLPAQASAQAGEDPHDRQRIAVEIEYLCKKVGFFEQHWMRLAAQKLFKGSAAEQREAAATKTDTANGLANERTRQTAAYAARAKALGCGTEAEAYLIPAIRTGWVEVGVAVQTAVQFELIEGPYKRIMTDEQKRLGSAVHATMRSRLGESFAQASTEIDRRMALLSVERSKGMVNLASASGIFVEMTLTADPVFTTARFAQAMTAAGYAPREVPIGDGADPGILLTPTRPGGTRMIALALPKKFRIPTGMQAWADAQGMLAVSEDGSLVLAAIQPESATLPAKLRGVLSSRQGSPGHGTRLTTPCPGTLCFAFKAADYEAQASYGSISHDAIITTRDANYPAANANEAVTVRAARLKAARGALAGLN